MQYSLAQFETDISGLKPRFVDIYVLPALLVIAGRQGKKPLGRFTRRMLIFGGIYMMFRNYTKYKEAVEKIRGLEMSDITNLPKTLQIKANEFVEQAQGV